MPEDYKTARRQMTGNMPTGEYRMAELAFTVSRKEPELDLLYFTSFADFERWHDQQEAS